MSFTTINPHGSVSLFVKSIQVFENKDHGKQTSLPFFADGYPGIMFQQTESGLVVMPHNKQMPALFLYGQTVHPVQLDVRGAYSLLVFQLYPFVIRSFFNVQPQQLNDACYDLASPDRPEAAKTISLLNGSPGIADRIEIITAFLLHHFQQKKERLDYKIREAIGLIIEGDGLQAIHDLRKQLFISERTFERRFIAEAGVSPKQFSKMIQFQKSLTDLAHEDYSRLTDIVYNNGFADQSHFIRVFKSFTGKTPGRFMPDQADHN